MFRHQMHSEMKKCSRDANTARWL